MRRAVPQAAEGNIEYLEEVTGRFGVNDPVEAPAPAPAPVAADHGTVAELIRFIYPECNAVETPCPVWPPDVFAIVATVMRRNGTYVRCVETGVSSQSNSSPPCLLLPDWSKRAPEVGDDWRERICAAFKESRGTGASFGKCLETVAVPDEVSAAWRQLLEQARVCRLEDSFKNDALCKALIELGAYADEASVGIGVQWFGDDEDLFGAAASVFLELNRRLSFCHRISEQKARVLAKKHTPQQGLTLRSMSHHLSLCMPWEVEAQWFEFDAPQHYDVLNILLLPWPLKADAPEFRCIEESSVNLLKQKYRTFEYSRKPMSEDELKGELIRAIDAALTQVSTLHAIVLPELALTQAEWEVAESIALKRRVLLISGIIDDVDDVTRLPMNSCRIQLASLTSRTDDAPSVKPPSYRQGKHHRWCLDRSQVLQYDLGGQLPSATRCWENSYVGKRGIFFATLGGWLTFSVLICEDLARQDPIAEVLRSVGPNLVVALLMDGPQLSARWSARYASVLADDPGTSVLTLTSLGMALRSRPAGARAAADTPSRVIALWKDKLYGAQEIALDPDSIGCVLSLSCENREEFTADGRTDHGWTQIPVYSGVFQVKPPSNGSP